MYYRCIVFVIAICFYAQLCAQHITDSLFKLLPSAKEDTNKVNILGSLSRELRNNDPDTAIYFGNRSVELAQKLKFRKGIRNASLAMGVAYTNLGKYYEALRLLDTALSISREMRDEMYEAKVMNNIGNIYSEQGNYPAALDSYFGALKIREKNPDVDPRGLAGALTNIGVINRLMGNYDEALGYYRRSMVIKAKYGDKKSVADLYINIGNIKLIRKQFDSALVDFNLALKFFLEAKDKRGIRASYNNIGVVFDGMGKYTESLKYYLMYLASAEESGDEPGIAEAHINIGSAYLKLQNTAEARKHYIIAEQYTERTGALELKRNVQLCLFRLDSAEANYKNGLRHYRKYILYRDSLSNEQNTKKTVQVQMQYEFDKKSASDSIRNAENLNRENLKHENEIRQQQLFTFGGIAGFVLMLIVAIVSINAFRNKQKANRIISHQKEIVEEKQKEILDSIHYAKRIQQSQLPNERYISAVLKSLIE